MTHMEPQLIIEGVASPDLLYF